MLKSKIVTLDGVGEVEVREIPYDEAEPLFDLPPAKMGKELIKASLYQNGVKIFSGVIGLGTANACFSLVDDVLEINGMGKKQIPR